MKKIFLLFTLVILVLFSQGIVNAEENIYSTVTLEQQRDWEKAYQDEQQRIRQARLKQWNEKQQAPKNVAHRAPYTPNMPQKTPEAEDLFNAAISGNTQKIRQLLDQGLNINISNRERETALHMAAARGHYQTVIYLVNNGAYVNARTIKNWIPLHHATRFSHPNIVNYLLKHHSSAHAQTSDGLSAIDMARNVNDRRLLSILGAR